MAIISNNAKSDRELEQEVIKLTDSFGTIECDNILRGLGTKVLLAPRELKKGSIFVTAAHTLFDKENRRRYKNCFFNSVIADLIKDLLIGPQILITLL